MELQQGCQHDYPNREPSFPVLERAFRPRKHFTANFTATSTEWAPK